MATNTYLYIISLTPVLISRFLLNLRQIGPNHDLSEDVTTSSVADLPGITPVYTSLIGNLGEPLDCGPEGEEGIEDGPDGPGILLQSLEQNRLDRAISSGVLVRRAYLNNPNDGVNAHTLVLADDDHEARTWKPRALSAPV